MRLNQSLLMGQSMIVNSPQAAELSVCMYETNRRMDRSLELAERSKRQAEAKLENFQRRYDEAIEVKQNLESQQLQLEHEVPVTFL